MEKSAAASACGLRASFRTRSSSPRSSSSSRERASSSAKASPEVTASIRRGPPRPTTRRGSRTARSRRSSARASRRTTRCEKPWNLDYAHLVAVLLTEEHHRAELARLVDRRHERAHREVLEDRLVDDLLDRLPLVRGQRRRVGEVEAQLVRPDGGARLAHVVAENFANAWCRRCVAVWFAIVGKRCFHGNDGLHAAGRRRSPRRGRSAPGRPTSRAARTSSARAPVSSFSIQPGSLTWPPPRDRTATPPAAPGTRRRRRPRSR